MASSTRRIDITWENGVGFTVQTQLDGGAAVTVIDLDENGHLSKMWDNGIRAAVMQFIEGELDSIGTVMKG